MFTLDRVTLFFFSLSESYRQEDSTRTESARITNWFAQVPKGQLRLGNAASNASTPTLTSGSSKVSKLSKVSTKSRTAQSNKVKIKVIREDNAYDSDGAISERDERKGGERARAVKSPPKGQGNRPTSAVRDCLYLYPLMSLTHFAVTCQTQSILCI